MWVRGPRYQLFRVLQTLLLFTPLLSKPIGLVKGLNNLVNIFKEDYYPRMEGGILEAFGILFKDNARIYAYPIEKENFERYGQQVGIGDNVEVEVAEEDLVTIENLLVADNLRNLYKYIRENGFLETIEDCDRRNMKLFSRDVYEQVKTRKEGWQECLPDCVADMIENQALWKD